MDENEQKNLEELLSCYIDGELSERQRNEVKRLIDNNEQAAAILKRLQKNKMLLGSLPAEQAPQNLIENVRASLERKVLLDEYHDRAGVINLFTRRMAAAAAMIALVGALGFVIYNIVKQDKPAADIAMNTDWKNAAAPAAAQDTAKIELSLQTGEATAVNQFIWRNIILDNGLEKNTEKQTQQDKDIYALSCSRQKAAVVLEGLGMIWDKFPKTQISLEGLESPVENITVAQAVEIVKQTSLEGRLELAKNFAKENKEPLQKPAIAAAGDANSAEPAVIKPALASGEPKAQVNEPLNIGKIRFIITVTGK